ncbi:hypothetical protein RJ639_042602 [Escallonia herrerae]|uniref:F-box domain-containing protein n=1 Tax=Escallonia herrerae TaxID=1293975 RepID=A0AA88WFX5_9ASTE|nr:hypothetical protein RJ639_042602 [Escallonia herrerae]
MERLRCGYGEDRVRKRKRRRKREESEEQVDEGPVRDPLVVFGSDIMMVILGYLDARSVALSLLVSRGWRGVASSDRLWASKIMAVKDLWEIERVRKGNKSSLLERPCSIGSMNLFRQCEELWLGKAHIPRLSQVRGLSKLAAYSLSFMDGKRTRIMKEDLWDHGWDFHFNQWAPEYWRNLDPYWRGTGRPMRRYFHPDGSQTADPGDKVWGGHEACYSVVTSFLADGKIRAHYVRINRWPRMSVSRKLDWSWEMSNSLYCYSSIPDADKGGGTGPMFPAY